MAGERISVSTSQVSEYANEMEKLNKELTEELRNSKQTIDNLKNTWSGEGADETVNAYGAFANKYFENYQDIINQYVKFLRENVKNGYFDTETANINLADAFK